MWQLQRIIDRRGVIIKYSFLYCGYPHRIAAWFMFALRTPAKLHCLCLYSTSTYFSTNLQLATMIHRQLSRIKKTIWIHQLKGNSLSEGTFSLCFYQVVLAAYAAFRHWKQNDASADGSDTVRLSRQQFLSVWIALWSSLTHPPINVHIYVAP